MNASITLADTNSRLGTHVFIGHVFNPLSQVVVRSSRTVVSVAFEVLAMIRHVQFDMESLGGLSSHCVHSVF